MVWSIRLVSLMLYLLDPCRLKNSGVVAAGHLQQLGKQHGECPYLNSLNYPLTNRHTSLSAGKQNKRSTKTRWIAAAAVVDYTPDFTPDFTPSVSIES